MVIKMRNNKMKCLLGIELYKLSAQYIFRLREAHRNPDELWDFLPTYTINKNDGANNRIRLAEDYLQFTGSFAEEEGEYLLFNLDTLDRQFEEEISNCGFEEMFKDVDFEKILSVFPPNRDHDHRKFVFPTTYYLIVELEYVGGYCEGVYELDEVLYNIIGYFDPHTFELKKYDHL